MRNDRFYEQAYALPFQRALWEATLRNTTQHYPIARRDPIFTPLFTSFFTSLGFGATAAGIAGSLTTAIVTTAITVGIQMLNQPKPPKPEDGKAPKTQAFHSAFGALGARGSPDPTCSGSQPGTSFMPSRP